MFLCMPSNPITRSEPAWIVFCSGLCLSVVFFLFFVSIGSCVFPKAAAAATQTCPLMFVCELLSAVMSEY